MEDINTLLLFLRQQVGDDEPLQLPEVVSINLLNQIEDHLADIETTAAWVANNFKFVKTSESDLVEEPTEDSVNQPMVH